MANTDPCTVEGCDRPRANRGRWCSTHHNRHYRHGDVTKVIPVEERAFPSGPDHPLWKGDDLSYSGVHQRMRYKNPALALVCVDCGDQAQEWSYIGGDPDEQVSEAGLRYSVHPEFYVPRCKRCHRNLDHADLTRDWHGRFQPRGEQDS